MILEVIRDKEIITCRTDPEPKEDAHNTQSGRWANNRRKAIF
jgi:hypothetical protein